jgi:hypothetical protein
MQAKKETSQFSSILMCILLDRLVISCRKAARLCHKVPSEQPVLELTALTG